MEPGHTRFECPKPHIYRRSNCRSAEHSKEDCPCCATCKEEGHVEEECPKNSCFYCRESGHNSKDCPNLKQSSFRNQTEVSTCLRSLTA